MDHFIGFDAVVRVALGRGKQLRLYGPPGLIDNVNGKLRGYTWNLVDGYPLVIQVKEFHLREVRSATFHAANGFLPTAPAVHPLVVHPETGLFTVLEDPMFTVKAVALDHRISSFAYSLEEQFHINVNKQKLHEAGLPVGGWLRDVKEHVWEGKPDNFRFTAILFAEHRRTEREFVLGDIKKRFLTISRGQKLAYVVDARYDEANEARIVALARHADLFYCESPYLDLDAEKARARYHLTARQAGIMARKAQVRDLIVFHFSPRYTGQGEAIEQEAHEAFQGN
jgi:ribonuclease Z